MARAIACGVDQWKHLALLSKFEISRGELPTSATEASGFFVREFFKAPLKLVITFNC